MEKPIHVQISFVRHGETALNKKEVFQSSEEKLNDTGIQQAQKLAKKFAKNSKHNVKLVLCSNFERALMTAKELHKELNDVQKEEIKFTENVVLGERILGKLEGEPYRKIYENLKEKNMNHYEFPYPQPHYILNEVSKTDETIESEHQVNKRTKEAIQFILDSIHNHIDDNSDHFHPKNPFHVVVVSHGLFLTGLFGELILGENQWMPVHLDNTALTTIGLKYQKKDEKFHYSNVFVQGLNDSSHLHE
eukprot:gene6164-10171_t